MTGEVHHHHYVCTAVPPHIERHYPALYERTQRLVAACHNELAEEREGFRYYQADKTIRLWDAGHKEKLPGKLISSNIRPTSKDKTYVDIYDRADIVYQFLDKVFDLKSVDGQNMALQFVAHYKKKYGNAFWNGRYLVIGDGDDELKNFCRSLTVIAHEMGHAVQEKVGSNWNYDKKSGPLNEHMADFFGVLCEMFHKKQKVGEADWVIGDEVIDGVPSLRTFKEELAYKDIPGLESDPQPWKMSMLEAIHDPHDSDGNVHKYSKIGNNAFRIFATTLGGFAYEEAAKIWFAGMKLGTPSDSYYDFMANTQKHVVGKYGHGSKQETAVNTAWTQVELLGYKVVRYWE